MSYAKVCSRKVLFLSAILLLNIFAMAFIIFIVRNPNLTSGPTWKIRNSGHDYFETYANYSGSRTRRIPGPINLPTSLHFVLSEPDFCSTERHPGLRVLNYVHSAPEHSRNRELIRNTWSSSRFYSQFKMATVFFVGRTSKFKIQKRLEQESARFNDIIQTDFQDGYYNLTYKAVSALAWVSRYCGHVEYVLKTDDDVFVNIFLLMERLNGNGTEKDTIYCHENPKDFALRDPESKWYITRKEYPWQKYPPFCPGMSIYAAGQVIPKLYAALPNVPYLKLDDVYVSGLLRHQAGIRIKDLGSAVNVFSEKTCLQEGREWEMFCHVPSHRLRKELWMRLMLMEIKKRAKKSGRGMLQYTEVLTDLLTRDVDRIM